MNIKVQICGLIIIALLIIFYRTQRTLHLYREKVFFTVLRCALVTLATDILSIVAIHYRASIPEWLTHAACKAYLLAILTSGFAALFYVLVDLINEERRIKLLRMTGILLAVEWAAIIISPISVIENGLEVYSEGLAVVITYVFDIMFILATLIIAILFLLRVNKRRAGAVIAWMSCWIIAAAIQYFNNELLLVGFSGAIGMVILYVMLESPEASLDKQFNCFNSYAFDVYCRDMKDHKKPFSLLEINLTNKNLGDIAAFHPIKTPMKVISLISQINGVMVFKNVDYSIYVVSESPSRLREVYGVCRDFAEPYDVLKYIEFMLIKDNEAYKNSVELSSLLQYCSHLNAENTGELVEISDGMIDSFREEGRIADEIKNALNEDRVEVFLQPIYSFASASFETAEALVRIRDREGKMVSPGLFIPVAEKRGLIVELGERIFEKVCAFISKEGLTDYGVRYIEVNLSVVQCEKQELADQLSDTMRRHGITPQQVNFEITETGSIKTKIPLLENMNKLTRKGSTFSLDDFGKGESNLIYLIDMPVSILKMDYDLTKSYYTSEKAQQVIHSVIDLAHSLGLKVVAEGIETEQELKVIKDTGVDFIQGFYFSRPMSMPEYLEFIKSHNSPSSALDK